MEWVPLLEEGPACLPPLNWAWRLECKAGRGLGWHSCRFIRRRPGRADSTERFLHVLSLHHVSHTACTISLKPCLSPQSTAEETGEEKVGSLHKELKNRKAKAIGRLWPSDFRNWVPPTTPRVFLSRLSMRVNSLAKDVQRWPRSSLLLSPPTQAPWNSFLGTVGKGVPMGDRGPVNKRASSHLKGHFQPGKLAIWDTDRAKMISYLHGSQCSCLVSILPASTASCLCGV